MKIKSVRQLKDLRGKRIFLRSDFNVPTERGEIKDDYKIVAGLPTIRFLLRYKCKIIIATHLESSQKHDSTKSIALRLSKLLGRKVKFAGDCIGIRVKNAVDKMKDGDILMLENLRIYDGEKNNDKKFAEDLAAFADIYINNAFAASHRAHASVDAIKKYLPSYAGLLLEEEILILNKALKPKRPFVAVMGGAKISTKLPLLKKFLKTADYILVGGALANNFLSARGLPIGCSLVSKEDIALAKELYAGSGAKKILLPIDVIVSGISASSVLSKKDGEGNVKVKKIKEVGANDFILDIGPATIKLFAERIKKARTIIWNGPMGMFEAEHFRHGTLSVARVIAARSRGAAFGVAGGGETIEALKMTKMAEYVDWVSTGGGAMLAYLGGAKMPGLEGIVK